MSITRDQIYAVANQLNAQGTRPTLAAVRRLLGSGSFTTISEALNEWKAIQSAAVEQTQISPPERLMEHLHAFGVALWSEAINLATDRFTEKQEEIEAKICEKEVYYKELEELSEEYDLALEQTKECIEDLRHELTVTKEKTVTQEKELEMLRQRQTDNEAARSGAEHRSEELRMELNRAHQKSDQLQNNLTALITNMESMQIQPLKKVKGQQADKNIINNLTEEV